MIPLNAGIIQGDWQLSPLSDRLVPGWAVYPSVLSLSLSFSLSLSLALALALSLFLSFNPYIPPSLPDFSMSI